MRGMRRYEVGGQHRAASGKQGSGGGRADFGPFGGYGPMGHPHYGRRD
jgi:hypothetical protein